LADDLKSLVCSGDESASYIVRELVDTGRISHAGLFAPGLIENILAPGCPVSTSLTEQDKANLRKLAKGPARVRAFLGLTPRQNSSGGKERLGASRKWAIDICGNCLSWAHMRPSIIAGRTKPIRGDISKLWTLLHHAKWQKI
jgi:hypothetical protein